MIDRFARPDQEGADGELEHPHAFYGGTIEGLRERLGWLDDLGVGTLWISPVYLSRETMFHGWGPFHGYWVEDHMLPWPRLGTFEDLRALSDELRERDMRLLLDIVVNHVGYDVPLVEERPDWFNRRGPIEDWDCPEELVYGDVHGLPDLNQENPEVYDYLLAHAKLWIDEVRPDGFRLDAVKHVPLSFWRRFNADVKDFAGEDFYLLGEDLEGDPKRLSRTLREGHFDALFDFPVHFALVDVFCNGASFGRLASVLSMDHLYGEDAGRALVTLLDNHDLPRIVSACGGDEERVMQALTTLTALRGTPSLTWGTEVGIEGADEPENRAPMRFDEEHPLREHVKRTLELREDRPWLVDADTVLEEVKDDLFVMIRPGETAVALVVNRAAEAAEVSLSTVPELGGRVLAGEGEIDGEVLHVPSGEAVIFELEVPVGEESPLSSIRESHGVTTVPGPDRQVVVSAEPPPRMEGDLLLIGAGEALGHWDVSEAVPLEDGEATLALPAGLVAEYKLVLVDGSESHWESGANRYLLVTPGDEPLSIELTWREN